MDIGQQIVIGISVFLVIWYIALATVNRRRGIATYQWLQEGLRSLGKISEARWIGSASSGARLAIAEARSPFRKVEAIFLLESREILPLWIFNHLRGKRDELIFKASFSGRPTQEIEVAISGKRGFEEVISGENGQSYSRLPAPKGFEIAARGSKDDLTTERLNHFLKRYGEAVWQISIQKKQPHLIMRAYLPALRETEATDFFEALSACFETR